MTVREVTAHLFECEECEFQSVHRSYLDAVCIEREHLAGHALRMGRARALLLLRAQVAVGVGLVGDHLSVVATWAAAEGFRYFQFNGDIRDVNEPDEVVCTVDEWDRARKETYA